MKGIEDVGQAIITTNEFNELLKQKTAIELMAITYSNDEEIIPSLDIIGMKDKETGGHSRCLIYLKIDEDFNNDKQAAMEKLGKDMAQELNPTECVAAIFTFEAWVHRYKKDEKIEKMPSEFDDRQDVVVISGMTFDGRANHATIPIIRKEEKKTLGQPRFVFTGDKKEISNNLLTRFFEGFMGKKELTK